MESIEQAHNIESVEGAKLNPEQAMRDERGLLEKFSGKAKKLAFALMMVSAVTFGEGCNRDLENMAEHGVQVGEVIKERGVNKENRALLKELFGLVHPIYGVGNTFLGEDFIAVNILSEHQEELQQGLPEGERLSPDRINELLESFKATPKTHSIEQSLKLQRSVQADIDKAKAIVEGNPELVLKRTQELGTGVYDFYDQELGNKDGILDAEEQQRANIMRFTNFNFSALRRMELHAREDLAKKGTETK